MKKIILLFCASIIFLILWRHIIPGGFLFYQGIVSGAIAAAALLWVGRRRAREAIKDALLVFLLVYAFVFTIPTTVDRSYSVRMIKEVAMASPAGMAKTDIAALFQNYFDGGGGVERRLKEQMVTGTIKEKGEIYTVTNRGQFLASLFNLTAIIFNCGDAS